MDGRTRGFGRGAFRVVGRACRAEPPLVRIACKRRIPSVQNHAGGRKLRNSCVRSLFDDKRHYDFAARFCVLGNQRRRQFCTEGAHACKPLVFFVYVAAHRTERRHDQPEDSGKIEADSSRKSSGRRTKSRRSAGLYGLSRLHALCAACRWLRLRTLCVYFAWRMALPHLAARVLFPRYGKRLCAFLHRLHRNHRAVCSGGALRCRYLQQNPSLLTGTL